MTPEPRPVLELDRALHLELLQAKLASLEPAPTATVGYASIFRDLIAIGLDAVDVASALAILETSSYDDARAYLEARLALGSVGSIEEI